LDVLRSVTYCYVSFHTGFCCVQQHFFQIEMHSDHLHFCNWYVHPNVVAQERMNRLTARGRLASTATLCVPSWWETLGVGRRPVEQQREAKLGDSALSIMEVSMDQSGWQLIFGVI